MSNTTDLTVADVMAREVATATKQWTLAKLERELCRKKVTGFPVVQGKELVGVVSRSDIVRELAVERSRAETFSDYFRRDDASEEEELSGLLEQERFVAERMAKLHVADVMSPPRFVAAPDQSIASVAKLLVDKHIHRVPVVEDGALVGIVSSLDIVRVVARDA
jgi:CBS domain-containing protein